MVSDFLFEVYSTFRRRRFTRNLLTTAVSARRLLDLETTFMCIQGGLLLWLRELYQAYKKRITIPLNKNHSVNLSQIKTRRGRPL